MPRLFSESVGSFYASDPVVFSGMRGVKDMQLQVAPADPNGPRAPLRSTFDDPGGCDSIGTPTDSFSFPPGEIDLVTSPVDLVLLVGQPLTVTGTAPLDRVLCLWWAGCAGRFSRDPTLLWPDSNYPQVPTRWNECLLPMPTRKWTIQA